MKATYTPGPWAMDAGTDGAVVYDPSAGTIAQIPIDLRANRANARLIAAAPDLLEALEFFEREMVKAQGFPEIAGRSGLSASLINARAALAKARGNQGGE